MGFKVYDYKCNDCQRRSEIWVQNDEIPKCPACDSINMTRTPPKTKFNMDKNPYEEFGI